MPKKNALLMSLQRKKDSDWQKSRDSTRKQRPKLKLNFFRLKKLKE